VIADNVVHVRITAEEIGLAAVAASLVVGSGGWVANWRDRQARRREAAEERRYQNRGEAYTEALQSITHIGGYLQTLRPTFVINAIPQPVVALPGPTEQVRARALVMIYGSASMRVAFDEWDKAARSIEHADRMLTLAQDAAKMGSAPPPTDSQSSHAGRQSSPRRNRRNSLRDSCSRSGRPPSSTLRFQRGTAGIGERENDRPSRALAVRRHQRSKLSWASGPRPMDRRCGRAVGAPPVQERAEQSTERRWSEAPTDPLVAGHETGYVGRPSTSASCSGHQVVGMVRAGRQRRLRRRAGRGPARIGVWAGAFSVSKRGSGWSR